MISKEYTEYHIKGVYNHNNIYFLNDLKTTIKMLLSCSNLEVNTSVLIWPWSCFPWASSSWWGWSSRRRPRPRWMRSSPCPSGTGSSPATPGTSWWCPAGPAWVLGLEEMITYISKWFVILVLGLVLVLVWILQFYCFAYQCWCQDWGSVDCLISTVYAIISVSNFQWIGTSSYFREWLDSRSRRGAITHF